MRKRFRFLIVLLLFSAFLYFTNASWPAPVSRTGSVLLAHRGVHQTFDLDGVEAQTCTATRIHTPTHDFIENTLSSMRAAFEAGADIVELDIHPTTDGHFAVFHDWTLDCRTDGQGVTREQSLTYFEDARHRLRLHGGQRGDLSFARKRRGVDAVAS